MSKLGNKDWWLGKTDEQRAARERRDEKSAERIARMEDRSQRLKDRHEAMKSKIDEKQGQIQAAEAKHRNDGKFEDIKVYGDSLTIKGKGTWDVAETSAQVDHGANLQPRITATRVALTGPFALLLKKGRNKVFLMIETPDDAHLVEVKAKHEGDARKFALKVNNAAKYYADPHDD